MSESSIAQTAAVEHDEPRTTWYFTFGSGHLHPTTGEDLYGGYVVIVGTRAEARDKMVAAFGNAWSFQYETAGSAGVALFAMRQIEMPEPIQPGPVDSKIWSCPEECGYHIADGPSDDGEESTDELISQHLEEHAEAVVVAELETEEAPEPETGRAAYTRGLREIADWLDAHPEVPLPYQNYLMTGKTETTFPIFVSSWDGDEREQLATIGRAMGRFDKFAKPDDDQFVIFRRFGGIAVAVQADREQVCTKVVTGTREVTEEVPDPEALAAVPKVTVTKTVEDVIWECRPLLAEPATVAGTPAEVAV